MSYILSCCSTADLSKEHFESRDIHYICFHYQIDGEDYPDDLGQSIPFDVFYERMKNGADTKTAQVSVGEYVDYFTPFLDEGRDIIHVSLSSGISGTVNAARNAAVILHERYPDRKIFIIDSLGASSGYGLLMDTAATLRDAGIRGGRISKTAAVFGGLLEICPLMNMDNLGRLIPRYKIRTKKKVIREIVKMMERYARGGLDYDGKCYISMSACYDDARAVADLVERCFPRLNGRVVINSIGTTIGSHTGPGTVALFFWGSERTD